MTNTAEPKAAGKPGKVRKIIAKIGKKNIFLICAIFLIGGAVYLNWMLFSGGDVASDNIDDITLGQPQYVSSTGQEDSSEAGGVSSDEISASGVSTGDSASASVSNASSDDSYFATTQINRQRARDEAMEVLQIIVDNEEALPELKEQAIADISQIARDIECEANVEALITAKGFEECVAVINNTNANIIVKSAGLMPNEVTQIKEIVYEAAGVTPDNIKIIEKN